jgi:hypothetical protein
MLVGLAQVAAGRVQVELLGGGSCSRHLHTREGGASQGQRYCMLGTMDDMHPDAGNASGQDFLRIRHGGG